MDFSAAERLGFIEAFVSFWLGRMEDNHTQLQLQEAAAKLLRGCQEHFRAGVTRVSHISAVIPPTDRERFTRRVLSLLSATDSDHFLSLAELLLRDFPKIKSWLDWWLRDSIASMLFESERKMDTLIWDSIPATTNAEEAMHWKLYAAAGRNHKLMEGLQSLFGIANYYEHQYSTTLSE